MKKTKAVYFILKRRAGADGGIPADVREEAERAGKALEAAGIRSGILLCEEAGSYFERLSVLHGSQPRDCGGERGPVPPPGFGAEPGEALLLCDDGGLLRKLRARGFYAAGYSHAFNEADRFDGAPYVIQEPDLVDPDSYQKMFEREAGLPWTILRTRRCLVREFKGEDLDRLYGLYDETARRFLEPLSKDREREREILGAYVRRIYPFYGFGYWAVEAGPLSGLPAGEGELIGRAGFAPLTAPQEQEAMELGFGGENGKDCGIDADFGFLIRPDCRGQGVAAEVCGALLEYGFTQLGFLRVRADADVENEPSLRLLRSLGFAPAGERGRRRILVREF